MGKQQNALAKYNLRANRKINGWTLSKKLGAGGNGEVWMCKNDKKEKYAIKFFKFSRYGAAYKRFVDEVDFMEQHQEIHGVLPIIDKNLPSKIKKCRCKNSYILCNAIGRICRTKNKEFHFR